MRCCSHHTSGVTRRQFLQRTSGVAAAAVAATSVSAAHDEDDRTEASLQDLRALLKAFEKAQDWSKTQTAAVGLDILTKVQQMFERCVQSLEKSYELWELAENIWEIWDEHGKARERVGELFLRLGFANFMEAIGLDPIPQMIQHPRENPYVFYEEVFGEDHDEEDEE